MDNTRFDQIAKRFADRRLSRRQALAQGGVGLALGLTAGATDAVAQQASPEASPDTGAGESTEAALLFVQSFQSGSIAAKEGESGTFTLTLEQGLGQTLYFSDRPERIVGAAPTPDFLAGLGFTAENPPNAALIAETAPGDITIAVVELLNPTYDEATHTAVYDATVLADWESTTDLSFAAAPADLASVAPSFGPAHLFIDDCSDQSITCCTGYQQEDGFVCVDTMGTFGPMGFCWKFGDFCCHPCENADSGYWTNQCNATYSACNGACQAIASGCW